MLGYRFYLPKLLTLLTIIACTCHSAEHTGEIPVAPSSSNLCTDTLTSGVSELRTYRGESFKFHSDETQLPILVVSGDSLKGPVKMEKFLSDFFAIQIGARHLKNSISQFFQKTPASQDSNTIKELRLLLLSDAREQISNGFELAATVANEARSQAIERGRVLGRSQVPEQTINVPPFLRNAAEQAQREARERAERLGGDAASSLFDTVAPAKVCETIEKQSLQLAASKFESAENKMKPYLNSLDQQVESVLLLDPSQFGNAVNDRDPRLLLASQSVAPYVEEKNRLDVDSAIATHKKFLESTNDAVSTLNALFGDSKPSFRIAILSPNGKLLRKWDEENINLYEITKSYQDLVLACKK